MRCLQMESFLGLTFSLLLKNDVIKISMGDFYKLCNNYINTLSREKHRSYLPLSGDRIWQAIDSYRDFFYFASSPIRESDSIISFSKNIIEDLRYGKEGKDRVLDKLDSYFIAGIPKDMKEIVERTILEQIPTLVDKYKDPEPNDTKELHVWLQQDYPPTDKMLFSLDASLTALKKGSPLVHTTQTHCFSTEWITKGYRLFAHLLDGNTIEIKLGANECTTKEIRVAHNLEKMLLANAFGFARR